MMHTNFTKRGLACLYGLVAIGLALVIAGAASAADAVKIRAWPHPGYARIVFDWPQRVTFNAKIDARRLVVSFEAPFEASFAQVSQHLSKYVAAASLQPDGKSAIFNLTNDFRLRSRRSGNSVVVDLLDEAVSSGADSGSPPQTANKAEPPRGASSKVRVRTGVHAGYTRLVFDWPANTKYSAKKTGGTINLNFASPAQAAIDGIAGRPPPRITGISQRNDGDRLLIDLDVAADARIRHFRTGT